MFKNSLWIIFEVLSRYFLNFFGLIVLSAYFSLEEFGEYSFVFTYVTIFSGFIFLGIDRIVIARLQEVKNKIITVTSYLLLKLFGSVIATVAAIIIYVFYYNTTSSFDYIVIVLISQIILSVLAYETLFIVNLKSKILNRYKIFIPVTVFLFKILGVYKNFNLEYFFYLSIIESLLILIIFPFVLPKITEKLFIIDWVELKYLLKISWPLIIGVNIAYFNEKVFFVFLKKILNNEIYGDFIFSFRLIEIFLMLLYSGSLSYVASLRVKFRESIETLEDQIIKYNEIINVFSLLVLLIIFCFSDFFYKTLFTKYDNIYLIYLSPLIFIFSNSVLKSMYFTIIEKDILLMYSGILSFLVNIYLVGLIDLNTSVQKIALIIVFSFFFQNYLSTIFNSFGRKFVIVQLKSLLFINLFKKIK